ncbi:MAG: aminoacyl-histidine dipeptidase [Clostridia bacterium]|nr:aminoacyl-histidine dipeptidase [Clostridia bacterium]
MSVLEGLQPRQVFAVFEQIAAIPHGSGNTDAISKWCYDFAVEAGLNAVQDSVGNVIIKKAGSAGREAEPPVILQAHLDMVCEKVADLDFDFLTQGIPLATDGQTVWANGTTLGADNGIGLALILAIMQDKTLNHPPLEGVLTIDEETGLEGAAAVDFSLLKGRRMLNLDSEDEGIFTAGCAGGIRMEAKFPFTQTPNNLPALSVQIKGLMGGHSGIDINKGRINANKALAAFLQSLGEQGNVKLAQLSGGTVDNAIAAEANCVFATDLDFALVASLGLALQQELIQKGEPSATVVISQTTAPTVWAESETAAILGFLNSAPNGVQAMCKDLPDLVETSLNLGAVRQGENTLSAVFALRSAVQSQKEALLDRLQTLAQEFGAATEISGAYPGWEYRADSALQDTMKRVYTNLYGKDPVVDVIHAGLECGLFCEKCPELDAASIGPNMKNVHTPDEWVSVASVGRVYEYLIELLANL